MKKTILILAFGFPLAWFFATVNATENSTLCPTEPATDSATVKNPEDFFAPDVTQVSEKFSYKKLHLIPIIAKHKFLEKGINTSNYIPLQTALKDKKATITEQGNGESASVNNLSISNKSKDTVFLMAGDIITGGKQDRIVAEDMVINPGDKNVSIPVFCVEPHRWTARGGDNQFRGSGKSVSNKVRGAAVISKDQTTVWGKVAEVTTKNDATTSSGTYNAIDENKEYAKDRGEYETFFKDKFSTTQDVIGVIAMSGDTVIGCDIFGSSNLFKSQYPSLVYAYITDAITYGNEKPFNPTKVNEYYKNRLTKRYFAKDDDEELPMLEKGIPDSINMGEFNRSNPKKGKNKNGLKFKKGEKILHYSDL